MPNTIVFRRWSRAAYAAFMSLGRLVSIGQLGVRMLCGSDLKGNVNTGCGGASGCNCSEPCDGENSGGWSVDELLATVLSGGQITQPQALWLIESAPEAQLLCAAEQITQKISRKITQNRFDTCSIINAKSGKCSENCKWCAQSAHYSTGVEVYPLVAIEKCTTEALHNHKKGVGSFSLVTSGKGANTAEIREICRRVVDIKKHCNIKVCASLGLVDAAGLKLLKQAGVERYHCNLETAPSLFSTLCTTHTIDDKIKTLNSALECGMKVCSGGIIGMGETPEQRIELAFKLLGINGLDSIPINILQPISGTPLGSVTPLSQSEIMRTIAVFRFVHPTAYLRFAGGRSQLSQSAQIKAMKIGINSAITGDLLTTTGSTIDQDHTNIKTAGYEL